MSVETYNKKTSVVEAMHIGMPTTETAAELRAWCPFAYVDPKTNHLMLATENGPEIVEGYCWVVRDAERVEDRYRIVPEYFFNNLYTVAVSA